MRIRKKAQEELAAAINRWADAEDLSNKVCVYTTGSFGRCDASEFSDLDLFVVAAQDQITKERMIGNLQEIELLASIVHTNRTLRLPNLDADGGFLKVHPLSDYLVGLGKPSDDANNTFTGRLLLLLESAVIFGDPVFRDAKQECVGRYWNDYADHTESFLPAFLINDILRFWRTLCINYEAGSNPNPSKRRAKNYKLKYSRLLTCFSAIAAFQSEYHNHGTVSEDRAQSILDLTPLERLRFVSDQSGGASIEFVSRLENMYEAFLNETNCSKQDLYVKMEHSDYYKDSLFEARKFGDTMFQLLKCLGDEGGTDSPGRRFFRYITI